MTKWKWQAISQTTRALIAKDRPGLATSIILADYAARVILAGMGLVGSYYGVHTGIDLLR
jgi:hypothetical protein